ncbi:MAG: ATP-binding protein [Proteobacteria bacterium]|nr:ATP-binding protein [Pseudomonadota bacterium]
MIRLYLRALLIGLALIAVSWVNYTVLTEPVEIAANRAHIGELLSRLSALAVRGIDRARLDDHRPDDHRPDEGQLDPVHPGTPGLGTPGLGPIDITVLDRASVAETYPEISRSDLTRLGAGHAVIVGEQYQVTVLRAVPSADRVLAMGPVTTIPPLPPDYFLDNMVFDLIAVMVAVGVLVWPLYRRIAALRGVARRIGQGERSARADVRGRDALGELATAFNDMAARTEALISTQQELMRAVSHEFRTPIARIRFALEMLGHEENPAERSEQLDLVNDDLSELDDLVEEMLTYARLESDDPDLLRLERLDLGELLSTLAERPPLARKRGKPVELTCNEPIVVSADRRYLVRAVQNLVGNGQRYGAGRVLVGYWQRDDYFEIVVEDDGPGIAEADREQIFEPFARLEGSRNRDAGGTGLGLAIAARISAWHGGTITVEDSALGGARFCLRWPLAGPTDRPLF